MSMYSTEPSSIGDYRARTDRNTKVMSGVYWAQRKCSVCHDYKPQAGSTRRNGAFVCSGCK